ncbi:MAG TPA: sugar nucleotide-binding protein, partial [Rubrobacteraceae bacterium]|nr:sugar nucleotide-binding protein [Rubrobacteraceae bacterium]
MVTGAGGQLGLELVELLPERGHETVALSHAEFDVADPEAVEEMVEVQSPDLVVNAAAYTNVDGC